MIPYFRQNNFSTGLEKAVEGIAGVVTMEFDVAIANVSLSESAKYARHTGRSRRSLDRCLAFLSIRQAVDAASNNHDGDPSLFDAVVLENSPDMLSALIEAGADSKARDLHGLTAFDYAKENEHIKNSKAYWQLNDAQY